MLQIDPGCDAAPSFLLPPHASWPPKVPDAGPGSKTYCNYGGQGPLPDASLAAIIEAFVTIQPRGPFTEAVWPTINCTVATLRHRLAAWFGVEVQRVPFTENVSSGCVLPLWRLTWQAGDELLIGDAEHYGVVAACRELDRRHGHPSRPWLLEDAAQSLGNIPVAEAAHAADIYACTGRKWCCDPEGLGAVVLSDRLLTESSPTLIGWRSLASDSRSATGFHSNARRFEAATSCPPCSPASTRRCSCWRPWERPRSV